MENAYVCSTADILEHFSVTKQDGLSDSQVQALRDRFGRNGKVDSNASQKNYC